MTILTLSALINFSLILLPLSLALLLFAGSAWLGWRVIRQVVTDLIQLRGLWLGQNNGQILADLQQKSLALDLHHKSRMLDVEGAKAEMPIKRERLGLLASLDES
jgi:hypothetical protein